MRRTEPGASAEASKRYPSTLIEVGCAQHAMYKKVHDDAYSGANQPVYGKPKTMRPCTYLPLYSDRVCKTALHLNTRARRRPLRVMLGPHHLLYKSLGSRTPQTHPLTSYVPRWDSGRGDLPFPHDIRCAEKVSTHQRTNPARHRYPATAKPQRR